MSLRSVCRLSLFVSALVLAACGKTSSDQATAPGNLGADDIAKKYHCDACHAVDKKLVGPSWMDVAKKYKGDSGAAARLGDKITKGGSGVWGVMPMPPNPMDSDAERTLIVDHILGMAK